MENEVWKVAVKGFYEVSSLGRVRSIDRIVVTKRYPAGKRYRGRVMSTYFNENGYEIATLSMGDTKRKARVHCLVASAFLGKKPSEKHEVNHKDLNRRNNKKENLEWVTRSENLIHSARSGKKWRVGLSGEDNPCAKLSRLQVEEARSRRLAGEPVLSIASSLGVHFSTIYLALQGKTWKPKD